MVEENEFTLARVTGVHSVIETTQKVAGRNLGEMALFTSLQGKSPLMELSESMRVQRAKQETVSR